MLALALVLLQAAPAALPTALRDRGRQVLRLHTPAAAGTIDWDARGRTVTLAGSLRPGCKEPFDLVQAVDFQPTAATGLGPGRMAIAGRDGPRVRIELWRIRDAHEADGGATWEVVERACVWEQVDADSIGLLVWNPAPPQGAADSLRALWHASRELVRYDVDALGWATPSLEATPHGPVPRDVLHVPDLAGLVLRHFLARHAQRGLVLMLADPREPLWACESGPEEAVFRLALLDGDLDGRLDAGRRVDGAPWKAEAWGRLETYEQVFE